MARARLQAQASRAVRWGGIPLALLIVAAYVCSWTTEHRLYFGRGTGRVPAIVDAVLWRGRLALRWYNQETAVTSVSGLVTITSSFDPHPPTYTRFSRHPGYMRIMGYEFCLADARRVIDFRLPLWPVGALGLTLSTIAWIRFRRRNSEPGACSSCNYDLSGLPPGSPCPECAAVPGRL
jgi:hypothetical protein